MIEFAEMTVCHIKLIHSQNMMGTEFTCGSGSKLDVGRMYSLPSV